MEDGEKVARFYAARRMGLIKDVHGENLPDWAWHRYRERAAGLLLANSVDEAMDLVETFVEPVP